MPAEIKGLAQKQEYPRAKVGPKGFEWPEKATPDLRKKFVTALNELLNEKNWSYAHLAEKCFGRQAFKDGDYRAPRNVNLIRDWVNLRSFPPARYAGFIAQALDVSMARLLEPKGPYRALGKYRSNGAGNGNGLGSELHEPPPPPPALPKGALPAIVEMATHKDDQRFVTVSVKGTLPVEVAMSLFALIHPRP